MDAVEKTRNIGLDVLKLVCAFLVICIHTYDYFGKVVVVVFARAAVPVFFMITGFFYASVEQRGRQYSQIKKIFTITIAANLIYLCWSLLTNYADIRSVLLSWKDASVWLRLVLFNESPFRAHLWYLSALLYVLLIALGIHKTGMRRKGYVLIPILLVGNLCLGNYSGILFEKCLPLYYSRNYLFVGLPCFLLGDYLYQRRDAKQPSNALLMTVLVLSTILTFAENSFLQRNDTDGNRDFFLGTGFQAYSMFLLVKNNPNLFQGKIVKKVAWMGRHLTLGLYVLNVIARTFVLKIIEILDMKIPGLLTVTYYFAPLIMLCATSCVTYFLLKLWDLLWLKKHRKP